MRIFNDNFLNDFNGFLMPPLLYTKFYFETSFISLLLKFYYQKLHLQELWFFNLIAVILVVAASSVKIRLPWDLKLGDG